MGKTRRGREAVTEGGKGGTTKRVDGKEGKKKERAGRNWERN